jgi:hypothetical protein
MCGVSIPIPRHFQEQIPAPQAELLLFRIVPHPDVTPRAFDGQHVLIPSEREFGTLQCDKRGRPSGREKKNLSAHWILILAAGTLVTTVSVQFTAFRKAEE